MPVGLLDADDHGRLPVPDRVRDEVRDDPIEGVAVDGGDAVGGDVELDCARDRRRCRDDLLEVGPQRDRLGRDLDRVGVEAREVEELLDESGHSARLLEECIAHLLAGLAQVSLCPRTGQHPVSASLYLRGKTLAQRSAAEQGSALNQFLLSRHRLRR